MSLFSFVTYVDDERERDYKSNNIRAPIEYIAITI